jgi:hypothetical protein
MWEYRDGRAGVRPRQPRADVYVCRESWQVHRCGELCDRSEQTTEGYVCCLTGLALGERHEYHETYKTNFWGRPIATTHSRGPLSHSRRPSRGEAESRRVRGWVVRSVRLLFCSDARRATYEARMGKLVKEWTTPGRVLGLREVTYALMCRVRVSPVAYNTPCESTDPRLDILSKRIAVYALRFPGLKKNRKTIHAFVSACVEKLRVGHWIGTTEMFPMDLFVARHAPEELLHGPLGQMRCRYMSSASLSIRQGITSRAGLPLRTMRFE